MVQKQTSTKGFTILSIAGIINKFLAVIYVPILTLLIDDYGNGIYNAGYMIYTLVFVITNTGIPVAISKLVSEQVALGSYQATRRTLKISLVILALLGFFTSSFMAIFAGPLSRAIGWPEAYLTILALSPTMFFAAVSCAFRGYFQGRSNMMPTAVSQVIEQFINSSLTIIFAWLMLRYGYHYAAVHGISDAHQVKLIAIEFAAAGGTVGTSVGAIGSVAYLAIVYLKSRKSIIDEVDLQTEKFHVESKRVIARRILRYSLPITLGVFAVYAANLIDKKYTKSRLMTAGFSAYEASSLYGILTTQFQKIMNIPLVISTAMAATIIPSVSAASAIKDMGLLSRKINESLRAIFLLTIPAAIGLAVLAKPVITILFPANVHGWVLLEIGSTVVVLMSLVQVQGAILQGIGKTHLPTIHMVVALIFKVIINYNLIAIKSINVNGAVIGSMVCYALAAILNHLSIKKHAGVEVYFKSIFFRPLSISLVMGVLVLFCYKGSEMLFSGIIASAYWLNLISVSLSIVLGGIIYLFGMIKIKGITAEDLKRLPVKIPQRLIN